MPGAPGPAGCGGDGEVTGALPEPSPPQADENIAAASANSGALPLKPQNFGVKTLLIEDIRDDIRDRFLSSLVCLAANAKRMLASNCKRLQ